MKKKKNKKNNNNNTHFCAIFMLNTQYTWLQCLLNAILLLLVLLFDPFIHSLYHSPPPSENQWNVMSNLNIYNMIVYSLPFSIYILHTFFPVCIHIFVFGSLNRTHKSVFMIFIAVECFCALCNQRYFKNVNGCESNTVIKKKNPATW